MPHNFKLTGNYYVSVDGSDSNDGLTPNTPKRTVQAGLNLSSSSSTTLIIGGGTYNETLSKTTNTPNIKGDGIVILDGRGNKTFQVLFPYSSVALFVENLIIQNYNTITIGTTYFGSNWSFSALNQGTPYIKIGSSYGTGTISATHFMTNSVFINCNAPVANPAFHFISCVIINSFINLSSLYISNSYISPASVIVTVNGSTNYNNIQGSIIINSATSVSTGVYQDIYGRYYDLSITTSTGDGTIGTPYGRPYTNGAAFSFTNHRILYPTYNANSFSSDPKFNDIQAQDFTLQITSPHIGRASDGSNIGGTKYATRYSAKGSEFNTSAVSVSGLAFVGNDWTVSGGTTGEVVSAPILISSTTKVLQKISYNGLLEFNKLITGGTAGNRNVPDQDIYTAGTQGANPDRLVYYLRYSTQSAQPATNAEWDNGGYWTAGNYGVFEWNTKPSIDNAFLGNGDPAFNSGVTATFLNVTWIQLKVKLRNNYA